MHGRIRIGTAIVAAVATLVLVGSAVAQRGEQPQGVSAQQYQADLARGEALNKRYHLGEYSPGALAGPKPGGMTTQQWQAELARADALNRRYGLGSYVETDDASAAGTFVAPRVVSVTSDGFDWGAAGIGAGAAFGLALLASGTAVVLRQTRRSQPTTTS
jgi:hypothetical protein